MGDVASRRVRFDPTLWAAGRAAAVAVLLALLGCGSSAREERPVPVLIVSQALEQRYAELTREFDGATTEERVALEPKIQALRDARPGKSAERALDGLLAWVALEKADLDRAERLATAVGAGPSGTTRDLAQVVRGAVLRRRGESKRALIKLEPLVNKVIDPHVRELLNREVVEAALAAKEWEAALGHMNDWMRDAVDEDRKAIAAKIRRGLEAVPSGPLVSFLEERAAQEDGEGGVRGTMHRLAAQQLAEQAKAGGDVPLARRLLADWRHLLGEEGDSVAQLAAGQRMARVQTRTIGLLLSMDDRELRRRGIEVATGLVAGLGGIESSFRLVTRSDASGPERLPVALDELAALGASVFVAGLDESGATEVASYAREHDLPVLLLRPPKGAGSPFIFQLGEDPGEVVSTLSAALTDSGAARISVMGEVGSPCGVTPWGGDGARADTGRRGLVVVAGGRCAEEAATLYRGSAALGFGLDAAAAARTGDWVARGGHFPLPQGTGAALPSAVSEFRDARGRLPTWWEALGHDAGVIIQRALSPLPEETVEARQEMRSLRADMAKRLAAARADLWTSEARGFSGARVLPRTLTSGRAP